MERRQAFLLTGVVALILLLFITDLAVPLGVTVWVPYVGAVLLALWLPQARYVYLTAAVCSVLTLVAWFFPPPGDHSFGLSLVNRLAGNLRLLGHSLCRFSRPTDFGVAKGAYCLA